MSRVESNSDPDSVRIIHVGANTTQLMALFKLDHRTVKKAIVTSGVKPVDTKYGADLYAVHEIAPYLIPPVSDPKIIERYLSTMNHDALPKKLTDIYWRGQKIKQQVLTDAGDLWPTEKVVDKVGELFKLFKMSLNLLIDAVDRATELTPVQRDKIKTLVRGCLTNLQLRINEEFSGKAKVPSRTRNEQSQENYAQDL